MTDLEYSLAESLIEEILHGVEYRITRFADLIKATINDLSFSFYINGDVLVIICPRDHSNYFSLNDPKIVELARNRILSIDGVWIGLDTPG